MQPAAVRETALYVTDLGAAERFYGVVLLFNAEATREPPAPDAKLPVPPHGAAGEGHLCFAASEAEIDRWKAHLAERGVAIEAEFEWPKGGRSIYFRDPSGNSLEFANPSIWGLQ